MVRDTVVYADDKDGAIKHEKEIADNLWEVERTVEAMSTLVFFNLNR